MKLTLGFSPCPNDTFIFDALVNRKIAYEGIELEPVLEDVETLNQWAMKGKLDITKLSFPAFFSSLDDYTLLQAGSALGKGVGPLLVSKKPVDDPASLRAELSHASIAIPGVNTTANLLLAFAFPEAKNKIPMLFSAIEDAVVEEKTTFGVIIHENRFTDQQKGLHKALDLGEYWEQEMKCPIPLGGIAMKKSLGRALCSIVDKLIRESLEYAFRNYPEITSYVKQHSQAMSDKVMRQHIDLYVNDYSLELGPGGRKAILSLFDCYQEIHGSVTSPAAPQLFL